MCTHWFIFKSYNVFEKVYLYMMVLYSTNSCKYSTQIGKESKKKTTDSKLTNIEQP